MKDVYHTWHSFLPIHFWPHFSDPFSLMVTLHQESFMSVLKFRYSSLSISFYICESQLYLVFKFFLKELVDPLWIMECSWIFYELGHFFAKCQKKLLSLPISISESQLCTFQDTKMSKNQFCRTGKGINQCRIVERTAS